MFFSGVMELIAVVYMFQHCVICIQWGRCFWSLAIHHLDSSQRNG